MKKQLILLVTIIGTFTPFLHTTEAPPSPEEQQAAGFFGRMFSGWGRAASGSGSSSSDYLGIGNAGKSLSSSLAFSSLFFARALVDATKEFGKSIESAAKDTSIDARINMNFNSTDLRDIKRITGDLVDVTFHINNTAERIEIAAEHLANPTINISSKTTTQLGIIGLGITAGMFSLSTFKSLAEKYINRSSQSNPTTDGAIAAASCALLIGSAYGIYQSGRLAGNTPQATPKIRRLQRERARLFEIEDSQPNNLQMVLSDDSRR